MHAKRGLSDLVTNVLIILLVLVAIGIIWAFVRPTINQGAGQLEGVTMTYRALLSIQSASITLDESQEIISFVVERGAGEGTMTGLTVILGDSAQNSKVLRDSSTLVPLETKRISVDYTGAGLSGRPVSVSVVPIFALSNGQERMGVASAQRTVPAGGGGIRVCGDGSVQSGEACDDSNTQNGDGCSSTCQIESGWMCSGVPSSCTPDLCGNTAIDTSEDCDDTATPSFRPAADVCTEVAASGGFGNYYGGTLQCYNDGTANECQFDVTGCIGFCGNSLIDSGSAEECEGATFARTCVGLVVPGVGERGHYYSGTFKPSDCSGSTCRNTYAFGGCVDTGEWCGDGLKQSTFGEACDGTAGCTPICTVDLGMLPKQCEDGIDNDGDGWIDFQGIRGLFIQFGDPGCASSADTDEANSGLVACANGLDDDGDGKKDGTDFSCLTNTDTSESVV